MNILSRHNTTLAVAVAAVLFTACSSAPTKPEGAANVRNKLSQLQSDPKLASHAPVAIKDAELAVRAAEEPRKDTELANHLVLIADRKVDTASAQAQTHLLEEQRKALTEQQQTARLDSRTSEADKAHSATSAALTEVTIARGQTEDALINERAARRQTEELQQQLTDLNAKSTDRGFIVTLGDVLFATGQSNLKGGAVNNLDKLAAFLTKYPDRSVAIEGHTDNVGSDASNQSLSQRRAESVKSYLTSHGVGSSRVAASGKGEGSPIADNESDTGRQQNRRVEVIIANPVASSAAVSLR